VRFVAPTAYSVVAGRLQGVDLYLSIGTT